VAPRPRKTAGRASAKTPAAPGFIRDHLDALALARAQGLDVRGYFHWSLIDNFEWAQGWTTPFG